MGNYLKYLFIVKPKNILLKIFWDLVFFLKFKNYSENFKNIIRKNRESLDHFGELINYKEYEEIDYGIPSKNFKLIDKQINKTPSNLDLIIFLLGVVEKDTLNYFEIGVSVMKNFMLVDSFLEKSNLVAYDINPIVKKNNKKFQLLDKSSNRLFVSNETNNTLYYFEGDVLNFKDTKEFNEKLGLNYDFVYSDALHTKEGVLSEYQNLVKHNLNEKFILYYDDLDIKWDTQTVEKAVFEIFDEMKTKVQNLKLFTFWINGWLGQNEKPHKNAVITNFDFESYMKHNDLKLPFLKVYM